MTLSKMIEDLEYRADTMEEVAKLPAHSLYEQAQNNMSVRLYNEYRQIADWLKELESYRNMDKREYYKVYTDKTMEYGYGEFDSVDRARASIINGVIVRVIELKEIFEEL